MIQFADCRETSETVRQDACCSLERIHKSSGKVSTRTLAWMTAVILVGTVAIWGWIGRAGVTLPPGVAASDYDRVSRKLQHSSRRSPERDEVLFNLGGEQATQQKWESAAALFASVAPRSRHGREARYLQAQALLQLDQMRKSERLFHEYLTDASPSGKQPWRSPLGNDDRIQALHYLSYLLAVELRFDERRELLKELVSRGDADLFDTLARHFQSLMEWNNTHGVERLERACLVSPDYWPMQAVLARYRMAQGRTEDAWQLLKRCHEKMPDNLEIAATCLTCLEERGDWSGYLQQATRLPPISDRDSVILLRHRGQIAQRRQQLSQALACYQQALVLNPADVSCRLGLAQTWSLLEQPDRRKQELAAVQALVRIQNRLGWAASKSPTADVLIEIAQLSMDAGLFQAAIDVCRISQRQFGETDRFERLLQDGISRSSDRELP